MCTGLIICLPTGIPVTGLISIPTGIFLIFIIYKTMVLFFLC